MATHNTLSELFTAIANSLRAKTGSAGVIVADDFPTVIESLSTGGITPSGTKTITANGTHDVTSYANAEVNVPIPSGYIKPSGAKSITTNGTHDVTQYASATVNVPTGITPSGTKEITANGTYDVTSFASATVNVPTAPVICKMCTVDITSDLGNGTNTTHTLLSADDFVKEHYADDGFAIHMIPLTPVANAANVTHSVFHANYNIASSSVVRYGYACYGSSATALTFMQATAKLNGKGYNVCLRVESTGKLNLYVASNRIVKAGTYMLIMTVK